MKLAEFGQMFLAIVTGLGGFLVSVAILMFLTSVIPDVLALLVFFLLIAFVMALFVQILEWEPKSHMSIGKMLFIDEAKNMFSEGAEERLRVHNAILGNTPENLSWDAYEKEGA